MPDRTVGNASTTTSGACMFTIEKTGRSADKHRLVAEAVLSEVRFPRHRRPTRHQADEGAQDALIAAPPGTAGERIETHWNGSETINTVKPGDWVATSLTADGGVLRDRDGNANRYIIPAAGFPRLYAPVEGSNEFGRFHAARGTVAALHLSWRVRDRRPVGRAADRARRLPDAQRVGGLRQQRRDVRGHL